MRFIAIDVETANADVGSICQIGLATFENAQLIDTWSTYVNPEEFFDDMNVSIHGITEERVRNAPTFSAIYPQLKIHLDHSICVSHTAFDRASIQKAMNKYQLPLLELTWLDSARMARRTWENCAKKGYGLKKVCNFLGYDFDHHDALEDAKACGYIVLAAIEKTGLSLEAWQKRIKQPLDGVTRNFSELEVNADGPLYGETIVFTGSLSVERKEAAKKAAQLGCYVSNNVTKKTTLVVVGDQDVTKLGGKDKSNKHRGAEEMISAGYPIRILKEIDFQDFLLDI